MKFLSLITFILILSCSAVAQPLGDINKYLESPKIHDSAKMYYRDEIKAVADEATARIADSLHTKNNFTRPFYLLLVSRMFLFADQKLASMLFDDCYNFMEQHPDELVEFLYCDNKLVYGDFKNYWANAVLFHLGNDYPADAGEHFAATRGKLLKTVKKKNKNNLTAFLDIITARL